MEQFHNEISIETSSFESLTQTSSETDQIKNERREKAKVTMKLFLD
jgi:hypothetical protein